MSDPEQAPAAEPPAAAPEPAPIATSDPVRPPSTSPLAAPIERPTFVFFGLVAAVSLILDVLTKAWAEIVLSRRPFDSPSLVLVPDHLTLTIAYNKGGAWGL